MQMIGLFLTVIILTSLYFGSSIVYAQNLGNSSINEDLFERIVMNSTEFKQHVSECNLFLGIDYNGTKTLEDNHDFRGARVSFAVTNYNETNEGIAFYLNQFMRITSIFEYNPISPPLNSPFQHEYGVLRSTVVTDYGGMTLNHTAYQIPKCAFSYNKINAHAESPLKQLKSGIKAQDVVCKESLQLVIKAEDETPACVKPQTVFKLVERGWGLVDSFTTETMNIDNTKFFANYTIANAKILNIKMDTQSILLIVTTQTNGDGNLIIQIPQDLLKDSSSNLHYAGLIVLDDGQESNYKEIKTTHDSMILLIPFFNGTKQIEIIATYY